ncbi:MAG TPA: GntR family transcriptional regulator [Umezawaea sp.]|nr:GntR family transcriptional regulator [Umezawaea sp.]
MTQPADDLTAHLREQITAGELAPGDRLPTVKAAQELWKVGESAVRTAYRTLAAEGLVRGSHGRGTVVLGPALVRIARHRAMFRDQLGYYFDPEGQSLRLVGKPTVAVQPASPDIALRLQVPPGSPVVVRDRVLGQPGTRRTRPTPLQIATSYLPGWLLDELPVIGEPVTGPGGIYDRIEEHFGAPLADPLEAQGAVNATAAEAKRLSVPAGAALVRIARTTTLQDGRPVEINDTRMDGARFETVIVLARDKSARWPPDPAVESPQVSDTGDRPEEDA